MGQCPNLEVPSQRGRLRDVTRVRRSHGVRAVGSPKPAVDRVSKWSAPTPAVTLEIGGRLMVRDGPQAEPGHGTDVARDAQEPTYERLVVEGYPADAEPLRRGAGG